MLVPLIEHKMKDPFGLYLALQVGVPDIYGCWLVVPIVYFKLRHDNQLLQCIIEVFLVIMERRVTGLLDLPTLFARILLLSLMLSLPVLSLQSRIWARWGLLFEERWFIGEMIENFFHFINGILNSGAHGDSLFIHQKVDLVLIMIVLVSKQAKLLVSE